MVEERWGRMFFWLKVVAANFIVFLGCVFSLAIPFSSVMISENVPLWADLAFVGIVLLILLSFLSLIITGGICAFRSIRYYELKNTN